MDLIILINFKMYCSSMQRSNLEHFDLGQIKVLYISGRMEYDGWEIIRNQYPLFDKRGC